MTSKAQQIADAVVAALRTPAMTSIPAASVYRDLNDALRSESFPALVVELGDERAPDTILIGRKDRFLDVTLTVLADDATDPYGAADAGVVESYGRVFADRTVGGIAIDVEEGETTREREGASENVCAVRKRYVVHFRTTESSLEA